MLASLCAWLLKLATGDFVGKLVALLAQSDAGRAQLEQIRAHTSEQLASTAADVDKRRIEVAAGRAGAKLNLPVFWVIIFAMMGPQILMIWGVTIYNWLWWKNGLWPQSWSIAEFPPSIKPWADAAIDWLYDPAGLPTGIGSSLLAAWLAKK